MADTCFRHTSTLLQILQLFLEMVDLQLDALHQQVNFVLEGWIEVMLLQQPELIVLEVADKLAQAGLQMFLTVFRHNRKCYNGMIRRQSFNDYSYSLV